MPVHREVGAILEAPGHLSGALLSSILEKKAPQGLDYGFVYHPLESEDQEMVNGALLMS